MDKNQETKWIELNLKVLSVGTILHVRKFNNNLAKILPLKMPFS